MRKCVGLFLGIIVFVLGGCGGGLESDLKNHLAAHGIALRVSGSESSARSRSGFVYFEHDPVLETSIIEEFGLQPISRDNPQFGLAASLVGSEPTALWGIAGRPAVLKLRNGGQLEFLYLLTTGEGQTHLLAEYAYG